MPKELLTWLRVLDAGAMAIFAIRLFSTGLYRNYLALTAHILLELAGAFISFTVPIRSRTYTHLFLATSIPRWCLWFYITRNLQSRSLDMAPALATSATWLVRLGLGVGLLLVASTGWMDYAQYGPSNMVLPFVFFAERASTTLFSLLLLALITILAWFAVPVSRNTGYLYVGLAVVFTSRAAIYALDNYLGASVIPTLNLLATGLSAAVFLFWSATISVRGESEVRFVNRQPEPEEVERSIRRLSDAAALARGKN